MKYAVTGATGFIGGRVVRQLLAAGHTVHALVRDPARAGDLERLGVRLFKGDVTDAASIVAPLEGVDGLFHLAAWYEIGTKNRARAEDINIGGTRNVLTAMRDLGIPKGVYTSSVAVFSDTHGQLMDETYRRGGPWLTLYDRTKWQAHYEVAEPMIREGLPLVVTQPGLVYGPGDQSIVHRTLLQYLRGELHVAPQATAYCFGYVDDVAAGHLLAMQKGRAGESYILAGPMHTFIELFALCERLTGVPQPRFNPSPRMMRVLAQVMRVAGSVAPLPENYRYESLRVMAGVTYGGNDAKARRELGWTCRDIEAGMRLTLTDYLRELGRPLPPQLREPDPPAPVRTAAVIDVATNGPLLVRGIASVENSRGEPCAAPRAAGAALALCRCGGSAKKPFCDGTHARNGFSGAADPNSKPHKTRTYTGAQVTIHDRRWICSHATECTQSLPEVWRRDESPWIQPDAAGVEAIIEVVRRCPSGALTFEREGNEELAPPGTRPPAIAIEKNGPYRVTGGVTLQDPTGASPPVTEHYTLCRCGRSKNKPFCDGSHWDGFVDEAN